MRQAVFLLIFAVTICAFGSEPAPALPSRDPAVVLPLLRALPSGSTYQDVRRILGEPVLDIGSASPNAIFTLADGSRVHVKTRALSPDSPDRVFQVTTITLHPPQGGVVEGEGQVIFAGTPKT